MDLKLAGLKAVVIGGSTSIGAAIVRAFAAEGGNVAFCARNQAHIDAMLRSAEALPGAVTARQLDFTDSDRFKQWLDDLGAFDIFVPNVSAISGEWETAIQVDVRATVNATEAAVPFLMRSSNAAITYIGSKASSMALPGFAAYGAVKAAMTHYMKSLSLQVLPTVRVNTVSPGDTLCKDGVWERIRLQDPEGFERGAQKTPMKRLCTAEEVARVVVFISSPAASFVAGANWFVDGGAIGGVPL
ncbi:MAG: SDR family NAD(P)-dependent oxidoreductase [Chitinivibrionales bacterium]|nr:SDR family NAD(P)-dependent oxidoreductase [Chitinivibrionales bacterium]